MLAYLQKMEMTINNRMRTPKTTIVERIKAVKDNLQEAYNMLYMILEKQDAEAPSSPSDIF